MAQVFWKSLNGWSGACVAGEADFILSDQDKTNHMMRALWLTAKVEGGGKFGAVNSYDGAGLTAGLDQKIAIFPKSMTQGELWAMVRDMIQYSPCPALDALLAEFKKKNMGVMKDGTLRDINTGALIQADVIRNLLAPPGGHTPQSGPDWEQSKKWAQLFHDVFAEPKTFSVQIHTAVTDLVSSGKAFETNAYKASVGVDNPTVLVYKQNIQDAQDLAWCVYHSFSVNAPNKAKERLLASNPDNTADWPKRLIRLLGTTNYGRWHDTTDGANRYDRTRLYAMNSGMWPATMFSGPAAIMPKDFA